MRQLDLSSGLIPDPPRLSPDLLLAGPPCQGFSTAGHRRLDDPRNDLLLAAGKICLQLRPRVCVIENVPGVAFGEHKVFWEKLQAMLKTAGYSTKVLTCQVQTLGAAQLRTRLILLAWKLSHTFNTGSIELPHGNALTLRDVLKRISRLPNHFPEHLDPNSKIGQIAAKIQPGQKLSNVRCGDRAVHTWDIPEVFGATTTAEREVLDAIVKLRRRRRQRLVGDADPVPSREISDFVKRDRKHIRKVLGMLVEKGYVRKIAKTFDLTHTFNGKFRRLKWDQPSFAVDTRFGSPRYFLHPDENRGFTVREAARIQGFPDDYVFSGPISAQYRMIGNAVPPPVAQVIASVVREKFFS